MPDSPIVDLTPLQIQVAEELKKFEAWQLHIQGQVTALRVALSACLTFPQINQELHNRVQLHLNARLALMKEAGDTIAEVDGYESALRELLSSIQPQVSH